MATNFINKRDQFEAVLVNEGGGEVLGFDATVLECVDLNNANGGEFDKEESKIPGTGRFKAA